MESVSKQFTKKGSRIANFMLPYRLVSGIYAGEIKEYTEEEKRLQKGKIIQVKL